MRPPPDRRRLAIYRAGLALAIAYFVAGGVLALWFPADGLDLYVSYVAGRCSTEGVSPYERAAYEQTWHSLDTPPSLASTVDLPFAYPPSWIPVCVGLSRLPWGVTLALWKLLNVAFLVGSVVLAFRLLDPDGRDLHSRYLAWCFALVLSPTISVMTTGQTSLLVLGALLAASHALREGRAVVAGLALAVALVKPQLAMPLAAFLLFRREITTLSVTMIVGGVLTGVGLALSHSDLGTYVASVGTYAESNAPTSHIAVGIASLLAHLTALDAGSATLIGGALGALLVAAVAFQHRNDDRWIAMASALPVLLYLAPLGFRCNGYDLVALIPLFVWSRTGNMSTLVSRAIQGLCWALILPRGAIRFAFDAVPAGLVADDVFRVAELSFRSWILVLLLPLVLLAMRAATPDVRSA